MEIIKINEDSKEMWVEIGNVNIPKTSEWFETTNSTRLRSPHRNRPIALPYYFGIYIDLENMCYTRNADLGCGYPTLSDLVEQGVIKHCKSYREYDINLGSHFRLTKTNLKRIIEEFRNHGFFVTADAIRHNYNAWRADEKSGYRDAENGYHLFTPCGCNPFSLRCSELSYKGDIDWQTTYTC